MKKNIGLISAVAIALTFLLLSFLSLPYWVQAKPDPQNDRGSVLYVSSDGSSITCTSWADACDLQTALAAAEATDEIWVKTGPYYPTDDTDRTVSFWLKNGVALYGGFAGTETARDHRDWVLNPTILSGDLGVVGDTNDNSYHVVYGYELDASTILDGFTITAGNADGSSAASNGGGMYNDDGDPTLTNVTFSGNTASTDGGGMYNLWYSSPTLTNVTFSGNSATFGGGMYNYINSSPMLINVTFSGNTADIFGGGMFNNNYSSPTLTNVTFSGNTAAYGGGMCNLWYSSPTLTNVTFSGNSASVNGIGMYNDSNSNPTLTNCILWGNTSTAIVQIFNNSSTPIVTYSDIEGEDVYAGDGNINLDPRLGPLADNGGFTLTHALLPGSPTIDAGKSSACPATDQRGAPRPLDGDGDGIPGCDMGAYEYQNIIFVDQEATGLNDGSCWDNAFVDLQTALAAAVATDEIWVAEGTYLPSAVGMRDTSFTLKNGVAVYGGFAGTETARDQRDWVLNPTILSGDLGVVDNTSDNSYHVVYGSSVDALARLDGFTISDGNANVAGSTWGGGMLCVNCNLTIQNVSFTDNLADAGGGLFVDGGNPSLVDVVFINNTVNINGGGMHTNNTANPTLINVTFQGNQAPNGWGGGMMNWLNNDPILSNVHFLNNTAGYGGGMYNKDESSPTLTNVTFSGNTASSIGGGMYNFGSNPTLTNVTFSGNSVTGDGGGMYNRISSPTLTNVTFSSNSATAAGGGMYNYDHVNPTLTNVTFSGNSASHGGGMFNNWYSSPTLTNVTFYGNTAFVNGVGIYNYLSNPSLTNAILWGNATSEIVQIFNDSSTPVVTYCDIQGELYAGEGNINSAPLLGPLADNGGFTMTHALLPGSPAIDAGSSSACPATDQRGVIRPLDGDGDGTYGCDMGAYEYQIIFVDQQAAGLDDGSSWGNAFVDLQDALETVATVSEIWVAEGTYYPTDGTDRTVSFQLKNGVALYGGFAGTEVARDQRDWVLNPTILSGDLGNVRTTSDNSYHVVYNSVVDSSAVLDGFTITAGNADGSSTAAYGAGMYNTNSSPTLTNVTFSGNTASSNGGGMLNYSNSSPILTNITFSGNSAYAGGGMYSEISSPTLTNVTFSGNTAGYGGGIYNYDNSNSTLTNVTFSSNSASYGGGMYNDTSSPTLTNVTFSGNSVTGQGGGIYNTNSNPTLINAILWGNTPDQITNITSTPDITYSVIQGGWPGETNIGDDPRLGPLADNGGFTLTHALLPGSPAIDAGSPSVCPATDQRGVTRPIDGDGDGEAKCDMGAYEYNLVFTNFLPLLLS